MKEPTPFLDLLLQLGISSETSVFQKAKKQNFTTFFSGPQQIRDLIDVDYDTTDHRNFISDYLIDKNLCLEDGRVCSILNVLMSNLIFKKLMDDQLEKMELFLETTNDSKFFSVLFLDDYGSQKSLIDYDFSELLTRLNQKGIFESTTLIITSYDLSINEMTDKNSRNPLFAVRLSDNLMKSQPTELYFLHLNFYRFLSTSHSYQLIMNLLEPKTKNDLSPFTLKSTSRNCMSEGIPDNMCLCMKPINEPNFPEPSKRKFPESLRKEFAKEIQKYKCVQSFEVNNSTEFFEYDSERGKIIALELTAQATIISKNNTKV
ncbi:hypothetical protein CAEBREN_28083 [Caenorhabditis brenneri]|uniref:Uncharacterized protein n=1 Tax=Caenorhabditis brenneri TaxID=135651 RepID=G0P9K0_CAEBE|nr:hypothetical protein CAEBREN_28083 [Caenorhabditis brenneri]